MAEEATARPFSGVKLQEITSDASYRTKTEVDSKLRKAAEMVARTLEQLGDECLAEGERRRNEFHRLAKLIRD